VTRSREIAAAFGLAALSLVAFLLVLEIGLRMAASFDENQLDALMDRPRAEPDRPLFLVDLIRRHPDDAVVYELRPGTRGRYLGHELRINSLGMRDEERARRKPPGSHRSLVLGDSEVFGWGVAQNEAFPAVLERLLQERHPERTFEVLNAGVPGYNSVQEVRVFELRADELAPDLVLINYVDNDMDLPNFLSLPPDVWSLRRSFAVELVSRRISLMRGWHVAPGGMVGVPVDPADRYRLPEERIPERFRPLQGWENMLAAYRRLARLARERGIPVVLVFNWEDYGLRILGETDDVLPPHARKLAELCEREGYLVVDPQDRVMRHLQRHGLAQDVLWYEPDDRHSSPLRHRLVAEEIAARLDASGLLEHTGR